MPTEITPGIVHDFLLVSRYINKSKKENIVVTNHHFAIVFQIVRVNSEGVKFLLVLFCFVCLFFCLQVHSCS